RAISSSAHRVGEATSPWPISLRVCRGLPRSLRGVFRVSSGLPRPPRSVFPVSPCPLRLVHGNNSLCFDRHHRNERVYQCQGDFQELQLDGTATPSARMVTSGGEGGHRGGGAWTDRRADGEGGGGAGVAGVDRLPDRPVIGHVGLRPQAVTFRDKWRGFCSAIWRASARWPASESAVDGRP